MSHPTVADLRPIDLFADLTDEELEAWAEPAELKDLPDATVYAKQDETKTGLILILEGTIEALVQDGTGDEPIGDHVAPTWMGAIPTLVGGPSAVRMVTHGDVRVAVIPSEAFIDLVRAHRPVFMRVMAKVRAVTRRITQREANRDRLAALGTMSAGVAHELNNPASAAKRAASDMADALDVLTGTVGMLVEAGIEREQAAELVALQREAAVTCAASVTLSALDAADAEDALTDGLTAAGIDDPWRLTDTLGSAGIGPLFG